MSMESHRNAYINFEDRDQITGKVPEDQVSKEKDGRK